MGKSILKLINIFIFSFSSLSIFTAKADTSLTLTDCIDDYTGAEGFDEIARCLRSADLEASGAIVLRYEEGNSGVSLEDLIEEGIIDLDVLEAENATSPITLTLTDRTSPITLTLRSSDSRSIKVEFVLEEEVLSLLLEKGLIKEEDLSNGSPIVETIRDNLSTVYLGDSEILLFNR